MPLFGIYRPDEELFDSDTVKLIEKTYSLKIDILSFYRAWNNCEVKDELNWIENISKTGKDVMITWEPWNLVNSSKRSDYIKLEEILNGAYDRYITDFVDAISIIEKTVYLRPMHEMNGNWYPWCGKVNDNSAELYIKVWHYLYERTKKYNPDLLFVWSPYVESVPDTLDNRMEKYFPGENFVDFIGLDGYNWGNEREWSCWKSFREIFLPAYRVVKDLCDRPIIIAEVGCATKGGNKKGWISEMFVDLENIFEVYGLIWFDVNKEADWRFNSY